MKTIYLTVIILLFSGAPFHTMAIDASTQRDMPFVTTSKYCLSCHTKEQASSYKNDTTRSCSTFCKTCHEDLGGHHKTDMRLKGPASEKAALLDNKVACFTCHDLKKVRFDSSSWKSQSLYESLFNSKKVYSTYFLIEKNNEGQLCKRCH